MAKMTFTVIIFVHLHVASVSGKIVLASQSAEDKAMWPQNQQGIKTNKNAVKTRQ